MHFQAEVCLSSAANDQLLCPSCFVVVVVVVARFSHWLYSAEALGAAAEVAAAPVCERKERKETKEKLKVFCIQRARWE